LAKQEGKKPAKSSSSSSFATRIAGVAILGAVIGGYARAWTLGTWPGGHPWSGIGLGLSGLILFAATSANLRAACGILAILLTGLWLWQVL
jgi:hypothetical protein